MGDQFLGKFTLVSSENFDEYMKAIGVGFALRKIAVNLKPDLHIEKDGDQWTVTSVSTFKTVVTKFKLGEEFEETTPDGRTVKSTITLEDNNLIHRQRPIKPSDKETEIIRSIQDGDLHIVSPADATHCLLHCLGTRSACW